MALESRNTWSTISAVTVAFLVAITAVAFTTGLWVLTAIPVGFLFGFFQEKSDLCGSSAFSEVIMMKERSKVTGIWVIIAVSMAVFTVGSALGWIRLNPKPLLWASYLVGGAVFGVGMVLAGGCVSGTLFKTGQGNLNSMAALVAIPIGIAAVAYGPLHGFHQSLKSNIVSSVEGGPVTLASVTGAPFWLLALIIAAATLAVAILLRGRGRAKKESPVTERIGDRSSLLKRVMTRPWKPWQSGVAIGVLALAAYASSAASGRNNPQGVNHGVIHVELQATD